MNKWRRDLLTVLGLVVVSLVFAAVSWSVHGSGAGSALSKGIQGELSVIEPNEVAGFPAISFREFQEIVGEKQSKAEILILDARTDFFYENDHILGALNLDSGEFDKRFPPMKETLSRARQVIVYCSDRQCPSSKNLAQKLQAAGVKNIAIYLRGWEKWRKRKGAIEK